MCFFSLFYGTYMLIYGKVILIMGIKLMVLSFGNIFKDCLLFALNVCLFDMGYFFDSYYFIFMVFIRFHILTFC
jgi:hypothetical protein